LRKRYLRSLRRKGDLIEDIRKRYRHIKRYEQILGILMRHGFESVVRKLEGVIPLSKTVLSSIYKGKVISKPRRVRFVLQELGPTAVKFGQWMSTRPDILPLEYIAEFEKLQDRVPPFLFSKVREIIKEDFGAEIEDLYDSFSQEVIASGSIAQVHRARLKDGTEVVVKVQRPDIAETIETDMEILVDLAHLAGEHIIRTKAYDPVAIVEEFSHAIHRHLDFWNEAKNIERFGENFKDVDYVFIPQVFKELTSSRVLTVEFINGIKVNDLGKIEAMGLDRKIIAENIANSYLKQVYIDGFFHGDPHPGNLFALPGNEISFMDFGIVGELDDQAKKHLTRAFMAIMGKDPRELAAAMFDMGVVVGELDFERFIMDMEYMLDKYHGIPLKMLNLGEALRDSMRVVNRHNIRMPPNLSLLIVTVWTVEGLVRSIDPEFNLVEASKPFVSDLISESVSPLARIKELSRTFGEYYEFLNELPSRMDRIMTKLEKGELKMIFRDERLERLNVVVDRASNRLIIGAIVSAIILGSSLVILSGKEPQIRGIPVFELLLVVAGVLGLWLVISILRSGRY
jgi:ubiquinone biosynthesis protein